jgi:hypothetical protein
MDAWIWILIAAFVVLDAVVTCAVLRSVRAKRAAPPDHAPESPSDDLARQIGLK